MKCQVKDCGGKVVSKGLCDKHRIRLRVHGHLDSTRPPDWGKRNKHPLNQTYRWIRQRTTIGIVDAWQDFWQFVQDVGDRPSAKHSIRRIDESKPYGPDNFFWKHRWYSSDDRNAYAKEWRKNNPIAAKNNALKSAFGITIDDYFDMLEQQDGGCGICGAKDNGKRFDYFAVDHCHTTNKVRGLLCTNCNKGLGHFKDRIDLLDAAKQYLSAL